MRTTRRDIIVAGVRCASALTLPALAACGGSGQTASGPTQLSRQPVTLGWMTDWTGGARGEATKQSIPAFEAEFPHIKLDQQATQADTYQALAAHLAAGTLADVALFNADFFDLWAERGIFLDIGPYLRRSGFDKESVWWDAPKFESGGKTYGVPYQFAVSTYVYNKTWFARDGVAPPTDAWTTDDLVAAGKRLTHAEEGKWALEAHPSPFWHWIWVYANGTDLTTPATPIRTALDQPKVSEVFHYAADLVNRHQVAAPLYGAKPVTGLTFAKGDFAVSMTHGAKELVGQAGGQFELDVLPTPRWGGTKKRVTNTDHQGHTVFKLAQDRGRADAAVQLVTWMGGEKGQTIVAKTGGATPVHKKTAYSPVYLQGGPANLKLQLDLLEHKGDQSSRSRRTFKGYVEWYAAITPLLQQGYGGDVAMREALLQATTAGNAALDAAAQS